MAETITIAKLDLDTDSLIAKATETRKAIQDLKDAQKIMQATAKVNPEIWTKNEVALKKLSSEYNTQKKILTTLTDDNNKFVSSEEAITTALKKNITSIEIARKNNTDMLAIRNKLNLSTEKGRDALNKINVKLNENNKFIKENVSVYEQQKIGIGDYEGAIRRVFPAGGKFIDTMKQMKEGLVAQRAAMNASTVATNGSSAALKILKFALIATGIGAIVVVIGTLIAAFASTQKGADAISKALAPIKGAFQGIIGVIQDLSVNVFGLLSARFTVVAGAILQNIDKIRLGWNKITGDTKETIEIQGRMKKRAEEIRLANERVNESVKAIKKTYEGASKQIGDSVKAQKEIERLTINIEKRENNLLVTRSNSMKVIKEQNKIAEDVTKTLKEREDAAVKAIGESNKLLLEEQAILDLKINKQKSINSQNDTSREDQKLLSELMAQRNDKETAVLEMQTTLTNKLNIIRNEQGRKDKENTEEKKKQLELLKEEVDIAIATSDRELEIYKRTNQSKLEANKFFTDELLLQEETRLATIETKEREHAAKLLEQGKLSKVEYDRALEDIAFETQSKKDELKLVREEADKQKQIIDLDNQRAIDDANITNQFALQLQNLERQRIAEVANASKTGADVKLINDKYAAESIKVKGIEQEAKLQMVTDTLGSYISVLGKESKVGKALAVTNALINTYQGITAGVKLGFPAMIPAVAAASATGFGAVKNIISTTVPKAESGGLFEIGGNRHSQGGTKFYGEDGTKFEAERGELIGVMSRQASAKFMQFNNSYTPSSGLSNSMRLNNTFAAGGLISPISNQITQSASYGGDMAQSIVDKINSIKVVAVVEDITNLQGIQTEIRQSANI